MCSCVGRPNALQAEQELREQARRNTRPLQPPACATRFRAWWANRAEGLLLRTGAGTTVDGV